MLRTNLITRMDPWHEFGKLQREMNRLFDNFNYETERAFPAVNMWTNKDTAIITTELPGMSKNDIKLSVLNNALVIEGERQPDMLKKGQIYHRQERITGRFKRSIDLPFEVDANKITANFNNGILTIKLPQTEESKPRSIEIKS